MQHQADERGKVFVGGLSWDTNNYSMLKYFSRYGEVIDCVVMKNPDTGKSRGFGFVTFKDASCVDVVLSTKHHVLDGRQIDPKACNPRSMNKGSKSLENSKRKIFIGGLPVNATEQELVDLFGQYGAVEEVVIMLDQHKQRSRGFGFLTFEGEESVDRVVNEHFILVNGKQVEVKRAEPRDLKLFSEQLSNSTSTPSLPYHQMGSILLTPSSQTPISLFHVQPPILPSPISLITHDPLYNHPHQSWPSTPSNNVQLINSNSPIVLIATPEGGSVAMTPSPSTPMLYQFWSPPSLHDPRLTFLPSHPVDDHQAIGGTVGFVSDGCSIIANVMQDGTLTTTTTTNNNSNNNANNNFETKSNTDLHHNHHNNNNNGAVDYNNNNILLGNNNNSTNNNLLPTNHFSNHLSNGLITHTPLYAMHPPARNHYSTTPAFHPYRR